MSVSTVNISFQKSLLSAVDREARREARSRSELLREAARQYLERKGRWDRLFAHGEALAARRGITPGDVDREIRARRRQKAARR